MKRIFFYGIILMVLTGFIGCTSDKDVIIDPPILGATNSHSIYLFRHDNHDNSHYWSNEMTSHFGQEFGSGTELGKWDLVTWVQPGGTQYIVTHMRTTLGDNKEFCIRRLESWGVVGNTTFSQTWVKSYNTFVGVNVGERSFIFGQDSDTYDKRWFTQEIMPDGTLAPDEADHGTWNDYYEVATPLYVNGSTYIFFQTKSNDHYWFISHVSSDGRLTDVCDGHWGHLWAVSTSVTIAGNTYLIGGQNDHDNYEGTEWFIQKINSDGTMGEEVDRGGWTDYYYQFAAYANGDQAYLFACSSSGTGSCPWFIQEISGEGKMGNETVHGSFSSGLHHAFAVPLYNQPGSFRYTVGWDLSNTSGWPAGWSQRFDDPWNGVIKMGGGAALAKIDDGNEFDAVLMGIQDLCGPDRYYYKIAWNLNKSDHSFTLSQPVFGPLIGECQAGGGADIWDIDGNGLLDLLFMSVDDPEGPNSFRYHIGWNLNKSGVATSWGNMIQGPAIGDADAGGGAALGDLDDNGRPELVFMGIDDPGEANSFWIVIGKNLDKYGVAQSWTQHIILPNTLGWASSGGGASLADINGNGTPDLILMNIDNPQSDNTYWCYIGWDMDINGNVAGWSTNISNAASPGYISSGGGAAVADIDGNGAFDLLLMDIDNPGGED